MPAQINANVPILAQEFYRNGRVSPHPPTSLFPWHWLTPNHYCFLLDSLRFSNETLIFHRQVWTPIQCAVFIHTHSGTRDFCMFLLKKMLSVEILHWGFVRQWRFWWLILCSTAFPTGRDSSCSKWRAEPCCEPSKCPDSLLIALVVSSLFLRLRFDVGPPSQATGDGRIAAARPGSCSV